MQQLMYLLIARRRREGRSEGSLEEEGKRNWKDRKEKGDGEGS